jgi:hypothetical protein
MAAEAGQSSADTSQPFPQLHFQAPLLNGLREKAKEVSSKMMKKNVLFNEQFTPLHIRQALSNSAPDRKLRPI